MAADDNKAKSRTIAKHWIKSLAASAALIAIAPGCSAPEDDAESVAQDTIEFDAAKKFASSDRNLVESLLFQWWGLLEGPNREDALAFFADIFAADTFLRMEDVKLNGREAIRTFFAALPHPAHAHHLNTVDVTSLGDGRYQLNADFVYQIQQPDGTVTNGNSSYIFGAEKQADGTFRLIKLSSDLDEPIPEAEYKPSYARNRARGTIVQFLGVADLLDSDYARVGDVLAEDATIHGMIDPDDNTYSERSDGVLRGLAEISRWLSDRRNKMRWVGHKLTSIELTSLGGNRYEATTIIDVETQPIDDDRRAVTLPIKIALEDNGGRFMHITRIER
jgi:hypothetical protein